MGFRFRKSFKLGPVRLNLSKSGVGASVGVRGARIGVGPRGARVNVGIPGTGIGWEQRISGGASPRANELALAAMATPPTSGISLSRIGGCLGVFLITVVALGLFGALGMSAGTAYVLAAFVAIGATIALKRRAARKRAEAERAADQQRYHDLASRFGDEAAQSIMVGQIWVGATADMVIEALGAPADTDERVLKTKTKHVYKYWPTGPNRYAYRVTLEDGVVVGWDDKR
jgi:hypothetical protein